MTSPLSTSLQIHPLLWQPRPDRWILTLICKLTFTLRPGLSPLSRIQAPLTPADTHFAADPLQSLYLASDLIPCKRSPEVLLVGSAFAPDGMLVPTLRARLCVGPVDKAIDIVGDRVFTSPHSLTDPVPFARMPLVWERASRGPDNPVGVPLGGVPNLLPAGAILRSASDPLPPAGFAPLAQRWPARASRLPPNLRGWVPADLDAHPLPAGFDPHFFNAAPEAQLLPELHGDEWIILENLHPLHARLDTRLAHASPRGSVDWRAGGSCDVELSPDTLTINTSYGEAMLTFRGQLPIDGPDCVAAIGLSLDGLDEDAIDPGPDATLTAPPPRVRYWPVPIPQGEAITETALLPPPEMPAPARWATLPPPADLRSQPPAPRTVAPPAPVPAPAEDPAPELRMEEYPIERFAAIRASIARRPDRMADVLAEHRLDRATWEKVRSRWDGELQAEARRGKTALLRAHDAAFVAQLEHERGPITPEHYARLIVSSEHADRAPALAGVDLPEAAVMPVERVMSARMRQDAKLTASVLGAVEAARGE